MVNVIVAAVVVLAVAVVVSVVVTMINVVFIVAVVVKFSRLFTIIARSTSPYTHSRKRTTTAIRPSLADSVMCVLQDAAPQ